jgi:tetratricopeptide (TPR) repeat protein
MNNTAPLEDYLPFELIIDPPSSLGCALSVVESPAGEGTDHADFALDQAATALLQALVDGAIEPGSMRQLGQWLFNRVFGGAIGLLFRSSLAIARHEGKRLRLRLRIKSEDVAALPWELLADPIEQTRLATAPDISLIRNLAGAVPLGPPPSDLPLRLLIVTANPADVPPLDLAGEMQFLEQELAGPIEDGRLMVRRLPHATVAGLEKLLAEFRPHILHIVCHGVRQNEVSCLVFEDEQGQAHLLDAARLRALLDTGGEARLLVLNACQSATLFSPRVLAELAPELLRGSLTAIVAMQQRIRQRTAAVFARGFYRNLALAAPLDVAVTEARRSILLDAGDDTGWSAPVLMLYGRDAAIFSAAAAPTELLLNFPAPPPARPPELPLFVGREAELEYFAGKLDKGGLAAIVGMPGVGKSSLANRLAYLHTPDPDRIFWHQFHEGERLDVVLWGLGGFLAWHGQAELWNLLQSAQRSSTPLPPPELLFQTAIRLLRTGRFLLWLDDFQYVDDDPILNRFLAQLRGALSVRELVLLLTSRRMPDAINISDFALLDGLSLQDTQRLLLVRNVTLTPEQAAELHKVTSGNAEFLTLAIEALARGRTASELLAGLWAHKDIDRYLLREVDEGLNGKERAIIEALAVCLGYTASREALQTISDGSIQHRTLNDLVERNLLQERRSGTEAEYGLHAILRLFYYHEQLSGERRRQLHGRAAGYYADKRSLQPMRAAQHYEAAEDPAAAADIAVNHLRTLFNQGHGRQVRDLLGRLQTQTLASGAAELDLALAQTCTLLGESDAAHRQYETLLAVLAPSQAAPGSQGAQELLVRTYLGLGELTADQDPHVAVEWLQKGVNLAQEDWAELRGRLWLMLSHAFLKLGDLAQSEAAVETALRVLPPGISPLRVQGLVFLAGVQSTTGKFAEAERTATRALEQAEQIEDYLNVLKALNNLANAKAQGGDPPGARQDYERALQLAEQLGDLRVQSYLQLNLGLVWDILGDMDQAVDYLQRAIRLAQTGEDSATELAAGLQLASLHARLEQWEDVAGALDPLEELAQRLELPADIANLLILRAELAAAQGEAARAGGLAAQAAAMGDELEDPLIQGVAERLQGKAAAGAGETEQALQLFAKSAATLREVELFETARTLADWADVLAQTGRMEEAAAHRAEAHELFVQTGNEAFAERIATGTVEVHHPE